MDEIDDDNFYRFLDENPPTRLFLTAEDGTPSIGFAPGTASRQERRIWEGYIDASAILLGHILNNRPNSLTLIFPALFNLRHGMEVALKWHIKYAGGVVPKKVGHRLDVLVDIFRKTAEDLDEEATYISENDLDMILELAALDPRAVALRYSTEIDGSPITRAVDDWDLRRLCFTVDRLTLWFDHLSGYIDLSRDDEYQQRMRELYK